MNALSKKYTDSATGKKLYSERTFYSDINDARVVFGACAVHNKAHDRKWLMERHKKTHRLLLEAEAWDALVRLEQQMYKTAGLNVVDDLNIDPADFGNHNYYMIISGATNNNLQINLNSAAQIPDAEKEIIIEQLNNHFDAQQSKLLEGFLKKKKPEDGK